MGVVVLSQYTAPAYAMALLEDGSAGRAYLLKERVASVGRAGPGHPRGRPGRLGDRPDGGRRAGEVAVAAAAAGHLVADAAGVGDPGRDGAGQEQRRHRCGALSVSERAVEKHTNSIFAKLGLSEEKDVNRRVKAVLLYLSEGRGG